MLINNIFSTTCWRHQMETFSALLALFGGNHRAPVDSPHKGQWREALMFSLSCNWTKDWANSRGAVGFGRHRAHYDVTVLHDDYMPATVNVHPTHFKHLSLNWASLTWKIPCKYKIWFVLEVALWRKDKIKAKFPPRRKLRYPNKEICILNPVQS